MRVNFLALIKEFKSKALVSGDKGYEIKLYIDRKVDSALADAPADREVNVSIEWE